MGYEVVDQECMDETVEHYRRMQEWVRTQPPMDRPAPGIMKDAIGENWYGAFCPYCKKYFLPGCDTCPLYDIENDDDGDDDSANCCFGLWWNMSKADTWQVWLNVSEILVQWIKDHG